MKILIVKLIELPTPADLAQMPTKIDGYFDGTCVLSSSNKTKLIRSSKLSVLRLFLKLYRNKMKKQLVNHKKNPIKCEKVLGLTVIIFLLSSKLAFVYILHNFIFDIKLFFYISFEYAILPFTGFTTGE